MMQPTWQTDDGRVKLWLADCLDVLPTLEAGSVDAVVTDPPYSSGGAFRGDRTQSTRVKYQSSDAIDIKLLFTGDNRDQRGFLAWCSVWLMHCEAALRSGGVACLFTDWRQLPTVTDAIQSGGFVWRGIVPWDKCNARPMPDRFTARCEYVVWGTSGPRDFTTGGNERYHDGIIKCPAPTGDDREHSTQKPIEAIEPLVDIADADSWVLDPFMGSGTTGVACVRLGRKFLGVEKEPKYFAIAVRRIQAELERLPLFEEKPKYRQRELVD